MRFLGAFSVVVVLAAVMMMLVPEFQVEVQTQEPSQGCPNQNNPECSQEPVTVPPVDVKAMMCKTLADAEFEASITAAAMCVWGPSAGCSWATAAWITARSALYAMGC